jgi:uncharacterized membrane protein (UPF0182 family)
VVAARRPPRRWTLAVLLLAFVVLAAVGSLTRFYTDLLWFREVDKLGVFWGQLTAKLTLGVLAGIGTAVVIGANLWLVERLAPRYGLVVVGRPQVERYRAILAPYMRPLRIGVAAFLGLVVGLQSAGLWQTFLLWRHAVRFGEADPQFHRDLGFYVFQLPFLRAVFGWLFTTLVLALLLSAAGHYLLGGIRPQAESNKVAPQVQAHLSVLVGLIVALKAWGYYLDRFELVYSPRGVVTGASYTDVHAQLPALRMLFFVAIICAGLFFWGARSRGLTFPVAGIVLLGLTSILVGGLYPGIVQRFSVAPQELRREKPYIARNIAATRKAFGLDAVATRAFAASADLKPADLQANQSTIDNIRLWDPDVLKPAVKNLQAIAPYYSFSDVDVDRYPVDNAVRQVMISSREVDSNLLSPSAKTWQNLHLTYTHGFGVVATQVNTSVNQGQPDFIVSNFDLKDAKIPVEQPRIYFGEPPDTAPDYVVVRTKQAEVDAPSVSGEGITTTSYTGQGGVAMSNFLRRLAFALRFRDFNLLISGNITGQSRLMFNRDIRDRVEKVAPFLQWDGDPYTVVVDGRIKFVRDGYTTTDKYPYSQRIELGTAARRESGASGVQGQGNYIRNSVKAVVDAYDGSVKLYAFDESDPILRAWRKAFPSLFAPKAEIPPSLQAHLRYPEDLFSIQTERYTSYHVSRPEDFYSREDFWALPEDRSGQISRTEDTGGLLASTRVKMRPFYLLTKLPGQKETQFILVMPFTPNGKENMLGYMSVSSDPGDYGKINLFSLDRSKTVFGPTQVNARILANREVSSQVSLLNQQGSKVILGNLLIVPIEDSLLYVQPVFVQGQAANSIPLLTNVAVFYNNQVGYATTLTDAIAQVVQGAPAGAPTTTGPGQQAPSGTVQQLLQQADSEFRAAQDALKKSDLAGYQTHVERAGRLVQQALQAGSRQSSKGATTTTTPKG